MLTQVQKNGQSYNEIVNEWSAYRNQRPVNKCIEEFCTYLPKCAHILDIGCGTGYPIAWHCCKQGFSVVGLDVAENMLTKAQALGLQNAQFFHADFLDFQTQERFDGVIAFDCLWHIEESLQPTVYEKVASMLKSGGYLLFTHGKRTSTVTGKMFGAEFVYSALDKDEVKTLLIRHGFEIVRWEEDYIEKTTGDRELLVVAKKK